MKKPEKERRKSVAEFFKTIENFDESAIYSIDVTNRFRENVKLCHSRNLDLELLESVIYTLALRKTIGTETFFTSIKGA